MTQQELTPFVAEVRENGNSLVITIDYRVVQYEGLKKGDLAKILIKKLNKPEEE